MYGIDETHERMLSVYNRAQVTVKKDGGVHVEVAEAAILLAALESPLGWLAAYERGTATADEIRREALRRVTPFSGPFSASTDTLSTMIQGVSAYYWAQILQSLEVN